MTHVHLWHSLSETSSLHSLSAAIKKKEKKKAYFTKSDREKWQWDHETIEKIKTRAPLKALCSWGRRAGRGRRDSAKEMQANEDRRRGGPSAILMALLWAGALWCHFKAFPIINQRLSTSCSKGPAGCASNYPLQHQHNGAIITAVTLRLGQTAHLYLGTYSRPINLPDMSSNKGSGVGGGGGV